MQQQPHRRSDPSRSLEPLRQHRLLKANHLDSVATSAVVPRIMPKKGKTVKTRTRTRTSKRIKITARTPKMNSRRKNRKKTTEKTTLMVLTMNKTRTKEMVRTTPMMLTVTVTVTLLQAPCLSKALDVKHSHVSCRMSTSMPVTTSMLDKSPLCTSTWTCLDTPHKTETVSRTRTMKKQMLFRTTRRVRRSWSLPTPGWQIWLAWLVTNTTDACRWTRPSSLR
mmetsp:Transcript_12782/g.31029  ORF Transcript_12782/g.31029 Transcript_12782/m.31029 type:complete len:223 (+) Transcript_12782:593-1261(+)